MKLSNKFALYIHIPWCYKKCPYCDFNAYDLNSHTPNFPLYFRTLWYELARLKSHYPWKTHITSIYFGGGTPSISPPYLIKSLIESIQEHFTLESHCEISMEVSPRTPLDNLSLFIESGINRFSIGIQSFDDKILSLLGREHTAKMIEPLLSKLSQHRQVEMNIDIIYGLSEQSGQHMLSDLQRAIDTGANHISWYELTIEKNTLYAKMKRKKAPAQLIEDVYFSGKNLLHENQIIQYETSAYSRNKPCRHNLSYWNFEDYIGIGAGAHSKVRTCNENIRREHKTRYPKDYMKFPSIKTDKLNRPDLDYLISRLRLHAPISIEEIQTQLPQKSSQPLIQWFSTYSNHYPDIISFDGTSYTLSPHGLNLLNSIIENYLDS